ncbi:LysR family transcriptional regulator [Actinobacteria bacterium YIM 96077]|uniref:LysR family transcriptional regulator n=1 Tax=Phytoactinopolyspora halophila TaxID=1981511 RepID=A0A329R2D1_9ACTN|nr:LysR family transcriptional regulator [Phytoactinopolyspora halophila]AYY12036.1 LysR family transcriptional regulator [Actinobacteria bacterium YIM 96077]RAW18730.1 LysR family transcriptional regulator [Phytoactinopolyspora halophila]
MEIELRHLRIVCTIAETGSLTKAAAALGLAQPAVTSQLKRIERLLGGPIFIRDRHGARPTELGEMVLARARMLLPAAQELQNDVTRLANSPDEDRHWRIGATAGPVFGPLVHRLATEDPTASVTTHATWSSGELATMLSEGRLDYALTGVCGDAEPPGDDVVWTTIATDAVFVMLDDRHPLAGAPSVELAELSEALWLAMPGDGCFADCFAASCARAGFAPKALHEMDPPSCVYLVRTGRAIALCQPAFRPPAGVVTVPISEAPLRWRQLIGYRPSSAANSSSAAVMEHARKAYQDAVDDNVRYHEWLRWHRQFGLAA